MLDKVALLRTEQERSWPQLTVDMNGAVTVRVKVADREDVPGEDPVRVNVYVSGGAIVVVLMVRVEVAP